MKRSSIRILMAFILAIIFSVPAWAEVITGSCGEKVTYSLDTTSGLLKIQGTGAMSNYQNSGAPWYSKKDLIKNVEIEQGVNSIGAYALYECYNLVSASIPNTILSFGEGAFYNCCSLESITIPSTVKIIGEFALTGCRNMKSLTIPSSVTSIGSVSFSGCFFTKGQFVNNSRLTSSANWGACICDVEQEDGLLIRHNRVEGCRTFAKSVTIPNNITYINYSAFLRCTKLTSVDIPNSVTTMESSVFYGCTSLVNIDIPNSVRNIGNYTFSGCKSLASVSLPETITTIGSDMFSDCSNLTSITIPKSVTTMGDRVFYNCTSLVTIDIPNSVTTMGNSVFYGCTSLVTIDIPNSVRNIGDYTFSGCKSLASVSLPETITRIGTDMFSDCGNLTSITIPKSVTSIASYAFYRCYFTAENFVNNSKCTSANFWGATMCDAIQEDGLIIKDGAAIKCRTSATSVTIPETVTKIQESAFQYCDLLASVTIPNSVTNIGPYAFRGCSNLNSIIIPASVTKIQYGAFYECTSLTSISLPNSISDVGSYAFKGCSNLASVFIPGSLTSISSEAFSCCSALTSITIPKSIRSIGVEAFKDCSNLTSITCEAKTPPSLGTDVFSGVPTSAATLYVPVSAVETYKTKAQWQDFGTITRTDEEDYTEGTCGKDITWKLGLESGRLTISGTGAIPNYYSGNAPWYSKRQMIKEVVIDEGITGIGNYAFYLCDSITSVTINSPIVSIGEYAFYGCSSLASINIPESLISIGQRAFCSCTSLTTVFLPNSLTSLGNYAFSGCTSLTSANLPESLISMGYWVFNSCPLNTPLYNSKLFYEFYPKSYSGEYKIPEGIETIGDNAFSGCTNLTSITIPNSVTKIGYSVFSGCYFAKDKFINNSTCSSTNNWGATLCDVIQDDGLMIVGKSVVRCKTTATVVKIPDYITTIKSRAFENCNLMTSVNIPLAVDSVEEGAFRGCTSLPIIDNIRYADTYMIEAIYEKGVSASFNVKEGTRIIGSYAFGFEQYGYCLTGVTIPNTVTQIGSYAFAFCSELKSITIPSSVTNIGYGAFRDCKSLSSITIPSSVKYIGEWAFSYCKSLSSITIPSSVKYIGEWAFQGCTFTKDKFVNNSSASGYPWGAQVLDFTKDGLTISGTTVISCDKEAKAVSIPDYITAIGKSAFEGCNVLTSVRIPNSVTSIENRAFYGCTSLKSLKIPDSVISIGSSAFEGCTGLTSVTLSNALTGIGISAFKDCTGITLLTIPNSMKYINSTVFEGCTGLTSVILPDELIGINEYAFKGCTGLASLNIPNTVTNIGAYAFMGCSSLKSLTLPNSVTGLGNNAFQNCSGIVTLTLSNSLRNIGQYAFEGCSSLTSLVIPGSVTSIDDYAFQNCSSLTTVELHDKLTTIKNYAFYKCKKLVSMHLPSGITTLGENFVSHCKDLYAPLTKIVKTSIMLEGKLHVPNGATVSFRENGWGATSIVEDIDVDFVVASGTYGSVKWELVGNTLTFASSYGTAKMTSSYTSYGTIEYQKYPWYNYRNSVKHVVVKDLTSIGEACLQDMNNIETLTTNTAVVSLYKNETTNELFTCFGKSYQKDVYEYYSNGSIKVGLYKFLIPSTLSKVVYTGEAFNMNYFSGGIVSKSETKTDEFHPTKPFEIIANNVTSVETAGTKSLKNTKVYITYTGNLTSGLFRDMGDLYSLTLNGTGVATEAGAFYTLFGSATYNLDMMYGGGGYYIPMNLKELHLMEGVTSIPESCFKNVTSLEKVYLPSTLRGVQDNAFLNCDGLTDIYVNAAMPPSAKENSFDGVNMFLCTLHVPYDSKQYYSIAKGWRDFYAIDNDADIRLTIVKNIENAGQIIGSTSYMNGEMTNITAVANGGYKFVEWTDEDGNRISDKSVLSVLATASCVYHAIFAPISNTGTIECNICDNSITLNWDSNPQVEYYKILLYTSPEMEDAVKEVIVDANGKITTRAANDGINVEISDLESRTNYYYRIVGYDAEENVLDVYAGSFETTDETSINNVWEEDVITEIYNIRGERMEEMTRGINIVRMKNGTTKKVIMK